MGVDVFRGVVPFVAVVDEGTFRSAAARLGVSPAAVSKAVKALEKELGSPLFVRGSRAVTLTREGALFYESCRPALAGVSAARSAVERGRREPHGELVVSAPFAVVSLVAPALAALRLQHRALSYRLLVSDRLARLGEEQVDVAVRVGPLAQSALIARKLCHTRMVVVASPSYLARAPALSRPADLAQHDCLAWVAPQGKVPPWWFQSGAVEVTPRLCVDHAPALVDGALAGLGLAQVFEHMVESLVGEGRLVQVLEEESTEGPPVHAICAPDRRATPRVRAAFEAFANAFGRDPDQRGPRLMIARQRQSK